MIKEIGKGILYIALGILAVLFLIDTSDKLNMSVGLIITIVILLVVAIKGISNN